MADNLSLKNSDGLIASFISWSSIQKGRGEATRRAYKTDLAQLENWLEERDLSLGQPQNISLRDLQGYVAHLFDAGLAKSSMARKLAAIRCFFQYLLKYGHITANITEKLHNPRQERLCPALLNVDEAFAVLDTGQPVATLGADQQRGKEKYPPGGVCFCVIGQELLHVVV